MTAKEAIMQIQAIPEKIWNQLSEPDNEAINMAISALEEQEAKHSTESSSTHKTLDTISRQALCEYALNQKDKSVTPNDIMRFPSAQPAPQWIPVSERFPESKHEDLEYPTVIVCCGDGAVTLACYYESTKEWGTGEYYDRIINPVAWMPLPKPYRAERRTDEGSD